MYGEGIIKGLVVTLKNFVIRPFTVQYPEEQLPHYPRFRGYEFVLYEDRCTGNAACAKYCPLGIIRIVTKPKPNPNVGEDYALRTFDIDIGRCMQCGLCVEACPFDALYMGSGFEMASFSRDSMVIHLDALRRSEKRPSAFLRPQLEGEELGEGTSLDSAEAGR